MISEPTDHTWIVDSIEERVAAVEEDGRQLIHVPLSLLPPGVREGDVLAVVREASGEAMTVRVRVDREATRAALERSARQVAGPPPGVERDPGGDIVL